MTLRIGISPCPNDTFIFAALHSKQIQVENINFEFVLADVEQLNGLAQQHALDIVKISYANYFNIEKEYCLLRSGGAMGVGVGPLLVSKLKLEISAVEQTVIALPGQFTTAHFLFQHLFPHADKKKFMVFSEIEEAVLSGHVDAGVIIHENRFTYADKGLHKILDLGEVWEQQTKLPIPLGAIAVKRSLHNIHSVLNKAIADSAALAWSSYPTLDSFVSLNSQEMEESVMKQHINLYVNQFTNNIGKKGEEAVNKMKQLLSPQSELPIFAAV